MASLEVMDIKELAEYLRVSVSTINNWLKLGLPSYKIGVVLRFRKDKVDEWIEKFEDTHVDESKVKPKPMVLNNKMSKKDIIEDKACLHAHKDYIEKICLDCGAKI